MRVKIKIEVTFFLELLGFNYWGAGGHSVDKALIRKAFSLLFLQEIHSPFRVIFSNFQPVPKVTRY